MRIYSSKHILFFLVVIICITFIGGHFYFFQKGPLSKPQPVKVAKNEPITETLQKLQTLHVLPMGKVNLWIDKITLMFMGNTIQQGIYFFNPKTNVFTVLTAISKGYTILYPITIVEGLTSRQIVALLKQSNILTGKITLPIKEGIFLPNTYYVTQNSTRDDLIKSMEIAQKNYIQILRKQCILPKPLKNNYQAVILASIVQKEAANNTEMDEISAVFLHRLRILMPLQADPTVIYALWKGKMKRKLHHRDLQIHSLYNTYQHRGLPPTPISNPGKKALKAVICNQSHTKNLYFVLGQNGKHRFSQTLKQHKYYIQQWKHMKKMD